MLMRGTLFVLAILASSTSTAFAQTGAWADKLFGGNTVHEFGTVPRGAQLKYSFKMTNIYKVPLDITEVRANCGCLTAKESVKTLQPQESATIDINMDATRFSGAKTIKILVSVGPQFVSTATLTVTANARQDVVFNPGEIEFGVVGRGQRPAKQIDVEYAGKGNWQVTEIVKNREAPFDLKVEDLPIQFQGRGYRLTATIKAEAAAGSFKQEVILKTNDQQNPALSFFVAGTIQASLSVNTQLVSMPAVKVGGSESKKIVVRSSQPFRVAAVQGLGNGLTAAIPDRESTTQIIELRFSPAKPGMVRQELVIRTDMNESVTIMFEGAGVGDEETSTK